MAVKSREEGRIVNVSVVQAIGVEAEGFREILDVDVITTEDVAPLARHPEGAGEPPAVLCRPGRLRRARGLKDAIASTLPGVAWQRCRTHPMINLLPRLPKATQTGVATLRCSIIAQPDRDSVHAQHRQVVEELEDSFPEAAEMLDQATAELLTFTAFPKAV